MGKQQTATVGYKRERGLTVEQQNAIDLLVQGKSDQETADTVGVNRVTVTKWRNLDPWFQAELNRRRQALWGTSAERLRGLLPKALAVLEGQLDDPDHKLQAAVQVVKLAGLEKLGRPKGETDAEAIIDNLARERFDDDVHKRLARSLADHKVSDRERQAIVEDLDRQLVESEGQTV